LNIGERRDGLLMVGHRVRIRSGRPRHRKCSGEAGDSQEYGHAFAALRLIG
jgi:hypothetical protein